MGYDQIIQVAFLLVFLSLLVWNGWIRPPWTYEDYHALLLARGQQERNSRSLDDLLADARALRVQIEEELYDLGVWRTERIGKE